MGNRRRDERGEAAPELSGRKDAPAPFPLRRALLAAALLAVAGTLAYSNSLRVPFHFDDLPYTVKNPDLRHLWSPSVIFPTRPVMGFSLALNYQLSGYNPRGYHAMNLLIHILAGITLFGIVRRTLQGEVLRACFGRKAAPLAFAVALLWMLHPLQTQAVTYLIQRSESLMGSFLLLMLYCAIRAYGSRRRGAWWVAAALSFWLALGTKQVAIAGPPLVLLYYWVFFPRVLRVKLKYGWALRIGLPLAWVGILVWLVVATGHYSAGFELHSFTPLAYALTQGMVITHYLKLAVWPSGLCLDYGWPIAQNILEVLPGVIFVSLLGGATLWALWRRLPLGFAGAWFFMILGPTSSFMPIKDAAMEHRMYLSLAGLAALAVLGAWLAGRWLLERLLGPENVDGPFARAAGWLALAVAATVLGVLTFARNNVYGNSLGLWTDTVAKAPNNARAHYNLGVALAEAGRSSEALAHYEKALELDKDLPDVHNNLGSTLIGLGRPAEAVPYLQEALRRNANQADVHCNLGAALRALRRYQEALAHYEEALRLDGGLADAYNNLGNCLMQLGSLTDALSRYYAALKLRPAFPEAHYNLAAALEQLDRHEEAVQEYREALKYNPKMTIARENLAHLLLRLGRGDESLGQWRELTRQQPEYAEGRFEYGKALARSGRPREALPELQAALRLKPGYSEAQEELARAQAELDRRPQP